MAPRKEPKRPQASNTKAWELSTRWAAVILALLTMLFFHQVVVGGKTFVSPDATQPAGFVRMGEQSLYQDRVYPLWNPFVFLGMPSFGSGAYNPLIYPPDWPLALLQKLLPLPELTWLLLYYFLGAFFTYLLAREWGARSEGALLAGAAFVFAPNLVAVGSHGHGSQLVDSAYLPLLLWLTARWLRMGRISDLAWLALAGGFQILRGHVQICFYTWMAVMLYVLVATIAAAREPGRLVPAAWRALGVPLAAALAFGVSAFYSMPLRDYAQHSIRGGGPDGGVGMGYATQWSLALYELPSMVVPGWTGFGGASYWGGMPFTDYPNAYVGMVTVLLAIPAFLAGGAPRVFALILAVVSLLIAIGNHLPIYGWLYAHLPLFNKFRIPVMILLLYQIAVAMGLAWGWSAVLGRAPDARSKDAEPSRSLGSVLLVSAGLLVLALLVGVAGQDLGRSGYVALATAKKGTETQPYSAEAAAFAYRGFVSDLGRVGLLGLLALGVAWLVHRRRLAASVATFAVLGLLLIELWPVSGKVMLPVIGDPVRRNLEIGRDDAVEFLEKAGPPGTFRILPVEEFQNNRFAGFGIGSIGGYHAAKPRRFQDLVEANVLDNLGWLRLLNVGYIVTRSPIEPAPTYLQEVHRGTSYIYQNLLALPRATVLGRVRVVQPARAILDSIRNGTSDSELYTFLEKEPGVPLGPVEGATARIVSYRLNDVAIEVETPGPGLLRLSDLWYPDWSATVDGAPAEILRADYLLRAVPVPAGKHRVEFRYHSAAFTRGFTISLVSLGVVLAMLGWAWFRRRRETAEAPGSPARG